MPTSSFEVYCRKSRADRLTLQNDELIEETSRLSATVRENYVSLNSYHEKISRLETLNQEAERQVDELKLRLVSDKR